MKARLSKKEEGFLSAVEQAPTDSTPRLAYADWLDKRDEVRGQLLRIWVEIERLQADPDRDVKTSNRIYSLCQKRSPLIAKCEPGWVVRIDPMLALPAVLSTKGREAGQLIRRVMVREREIAPALFRVFYHPSERGEDVSGCEWGGRKAVLVVAHDDFGAQKFFSRSEGDELLYEMMAATLSGSGWWVEECDWASVVTSRFDGAP